MLEDLGNLGDFVGGIAVIITLIYLATQVRQNTSAVRTASRQEVAAAYRAGNRLFFQPGVARAYAKGVRGYPNIPLDEKNLFWAFLNESALTFQGAFVLYDSGQLEEETYRAYLDWLAGNLATPGGEAWWQEVGPIYVKRMAEAVNERLAQGQLPDITQLGVLQLDEAAPAQA